MPVCVTTSLPRVNFSVIWHSSSAPSGLKIAVSPSIVAMPLRRVVAERALPGARRNVRIVQAAFGEEAGMLGAALFALAGGDV